MIHTDQFGAIALQPWYAILLGVLTMVLIGSGLALLRSPRRPMAAGFGSSSQSE
jgi:hypothetical protein